VVISSWWRATSILVRWGVAESVRSKFDQVRERPELVAGHHFLVDPVFCHPAGALAEEVTGTKIVAGSSRLRSSGTAFARTLRNASSNVIAT
jgi:hypothetical protein